MARTERRPRCAACCRPARGTRCRHPRPRRRFPYGAVLRQLTVVVLMLAAVAGIAVLLHQLPQQVDIMLLLSKAIDDLIGGVQQLLEAMLGLAAIVLIAAIALLAGILLLGALWRLIRIIRLVVSPSTQGRR